MNTINEIADAVHKNAIEKGFHSEPGQTDLQFAMQTTANIHGEVSEFWEAWRAGTQDYFCDKRDRMIVRGLRPLTQKEEELADIIIRALDTARRLKIDIQDAIIIKHKYNTTRPFMHGKKC